jgi:hypothetical protein
MNRKQIISLWAGIGVFVLMGLFPPWNRIYVSPDGVRLEEGNCYRLLVSSENLLNRRLYEVNTSVLAVQWALVGAVTAGLVLTFRKRPGAGRPEHQAGE